VIDTKQDRTGVGNLLFLLYVVVRRVERKINIVKSQLNNGRLDIIKINLRNEGTTEHRIESQDFLTFLFLSLLLVP
jgi:hypothetical protein